MTAIVRGAEPSKIPTNAWGIILKNVDWMQLPTNVQYYVSANVDWSIIPPNTAFFLFTPLNGPIARRKVPHEDLC